MFALSWQVTLLCLLLFPFLLLASRSVERPAGRADPASRWTATPTWATSMTERFNVGGAMLLKLFGRRDEEDALFADRAADVRDLGVRITLVSRIFVAAMLLVPALATAVVYGVGGHLAIDGDAHGRHPDRARHAAGAAARPAAEPVQRPDRRDDRAGQLRPGLRGARPALHHPGEARRRRRCRRGAASLEFDARRVHLPAGRRDLPGLPGDRGPHRVPRHRRGAATTSASGPSPARWWRWSAPPGPARPP